MIRAVSLVSGIYDFVLGILFLTAAGAVARTFGVPPPQPAVLASTNGLFLVCVGLGYGLPLRDPAGQRTYLWLMGVLLKAGGAMVFLLDYLLRGSPPAFLLFALSDGSLALWTWWALTSQTKPEGESQK